MVRLAQALVLAVLTTSLLVPPGGSAPHLEDPAIPPAGAPAVTLPGLAQGPGCQPMTITYLQREVGSASAAVTHALEARADLGPAAATALRSADAALLAAAATLGALGDRPKEPAADPLARAADALAAAAADASVQADAALAARVADAARHVANAEVALASLLLDAQAVLAANPDVAQAARSVLLSTPVIVWTSLNMGQGSCLDADLLDGLSSEHFLDAIADEAAAREAADAALDARIDALTNNLQAALDELRAADARLTEAVGALDGRLDDEIAARQAAINHLQGQLDALDAALDAEAAARAAEDSALRGDLGQLREDLAAEAEARAAADAALQAALDAETAAREAADAAHAARLDGLEAHVNGGAFDGASLDLSGDAAVGGDATVGGDLDLAGTLTRGTVPWARLAGHPAIAAQDGLVGGGDLAAPRVLGLDLAGIADCTAATKKLIWDAAAKRLGCGTDLDGDTTYTAGNPLALEGNTFTIPVKAITGDFLADGAVKDQQVHRNANISWTKVNKAGSSIADLTTRSASDLDSGTLADERLSGNVPLRDGANTFTGSNTFDGATTLAGLTVRDDATIAGALDVDGDATLGGDLALAGTLTSGTVPWARLAGHPSVTAGAGLVGGGDLAASRQLALDAAAIAACAGASKKVVWDAASNRLGCQTDEDTLYVAGYGLDLVGTTFSANATVLQNRVTGTCVLGSYITAVGQDGKVTCGQAVHQVTAGAGLTGGTITQSGTVAIADAGVTGAMLASDAVTSAKIAQDTITAADIATGAVGSAEILDGAIAAADVNSSAIQLRVTGTCAAGTFIVAIAANGAATCATDADTTYTAGSGLQLSGSQFSVANGGITTAMLADGSVTSAKIADGTITGSDVSGSADLSVRRLVTSDGVTLGNNVIDESTVNGKLTVTGHTFLDGDVNLGNHIQDWATAHGSLNVTGEFNVKGSTNLGDNAQDKTTISGDVSWGGTLTGGNVPFARVTNLPAACPATSFVTRIGTDPACGGYAIGGGLIQTGNQLSINDNGVDSAKLGANAVTTPKIADGAVTSAKIADGTIAFADLASNGCAANQIPKWSGTAWACAADADTNSGGTVTSVATGAGLAGGPITGSGTISVATGGITSAMIADGTITAADVDTSSVQRRVTGTCSAGNYVRAVASDGTVTCGADANSGGTVTQVNAGAGLAGGPITGTGTLSVANDGITSAMIATGAVGNDEISTASTPTIAGLTVNGRIGINTATPGARVELKGSAGDGLLLNGTAADAPNLMFKEATANTIFNIDMNNGMLRVFSEPGLGAGGGSVRMLVDGATGNVGVGPDTPGARLDVGGDVRWSGTLTGGSVPWARVTDFPAACGGGQFVRGVGASLTCANDADTTYSAGSGLQLSGSQFSVANGGINAAMIATGAVGNDEISTASTPTIAGLTVNGNAGIGSADTMGARLRIVGNTGSSGDNGVQFDIPGKSMSHWGWGSTYDWYIRSGDTSGKVVLQDTGGNVGIGTSAPLAKLHIPGSANSPRLVFPDPNYPRYSTGVGSVHITNEGQRLDFYAGDSGDHGQNLGADAIRMSIKPNGNVGIGTTSPDRLLHVDGQSRFADTVRMGSESVGRIPPFGAITRMVVTNDRTEGMPVARIPTAEFQRDGTPGGFRVVTLQNIPTNGTVNVHCQGINNDGGSVNSVVVIPEGTAAGTAYQVYAGGTTGHRMVYVNCMMGTPQAWSSHHTLLQLHRRVLDAPYWSGFLTSTYNQ